MGALDASIGMIYATQVLETLLFGVAMLQGWFYFNTYLHKDRPFIKLLVATVLALDAAELLMLTALGYRYYVTNALTVLLTLETGKFIMYQLDYMQQILGSIVALLIQHFYCWRIYKLLCGLDKVSYPISLGITIILSLLSSSANATAIAAYALSGQKEYLNELFGSWITNMYYATTIFTFVTDVLICATMIVLLQKSKTGFERSTSVINRLMIFTFSTGLPTALSAVVGLIVVAVNTNPNSLVYTIFCVPLGLWYTNCLLVNLNSRDYIRGMDDMVPTSLESIPLTIPSHIGERGLQHSETFRIDIETRTSDTVHNHSDPYIQAPAIAFAPDAKTGKGIYGKSGRHMSI